MSRRNTFPRTQEHIQLANEGSDMFRMVHSQSNIRKVNSLNTTLMMNTRMENVERKEIENNPFLKAKVKAYMNSLTGAVSSEVGKGQFQQEGAMDLSKSLLGEERVTFKRVTDDVNKNNQQTIDSLAKKLSGDSRNYTKKASNY